MGIQRLVQRSFRPAREASATWILLKTGGQVIVFWTVFLAVLPAAIVAAERTLGVPTFRVPHQQPVAWTVFALAGCLGLASGAVMALVGRGTPVPMDCPRVLIVRGPYRFIRNPMAVTGLAQGAAVALAWGSWLTLAYVAVGGVLWNWWVRPAEERDLEVRFGAAFRDYRSRVRCWIPTFPGYRRRSGPRDGQ